MPRLTIQQTNFTGGEQSPRLAGRTDIDSYSNAAEEITNAHPLVHGGCKRRGGTFMKQAAASATALRSMLVPWSNGRGQSYTLEFSNLSLRVLNPDGSLEGTALTTVYSDTLLGDLDWAQADSTMYLFFPTAPPYSLQRFENGVWALTATPFTQLPFAEVGFFPSADATLSLATVGTGRTLTASGATFLVADVGRAVIYFQGIAVITGYTSATVVTVEVTRAFASVNLPAGLWRVDSSPQIDVTPSLDKPVGSLITLTLAINGWRAADVGSMVRLNGGLCRIVSFTDAQHVNARILRELTNTTAAPALAWSLEPAVWSAAFGYPRTGTVFQQRLIAAGTTFNPRTVWGSRTGEQLDFELGTNDDQAFAFTIDSDEATPIRYVSADADIVVLTQSAEYSMRSGIEKAITPTSVRVKQEGNAGCAQVRPVTVRNELLFVQGGGRKVRSLQWEYASDRYSPSEVSKRAEHITEGGVIAMAYQQEAESLLWAVRGDGALLSCTLDRVENVVAWTKHYTDGAVESMACIPNGERDDLWLIVRRYINGAVVRFIEIMDTVWEPLITAAPAANTFPPFDTAAVYGCTVDCALSFDNPGAGATVFAVPHLVGETVAIVGDGSKFSPQLVPGSGNVTLPRAVQRCLIGLPFSTRIVPLTPEVGTGTGTAQGNAMSTSEITVRLLDSVGGKVVDDEGSEQALPSRSLGPGSLDQAPKQRTDVQRVSHLGWARGKSRIVIVQDDPMPLHVLSVIRTFSVNS